VEQMDILDDSLFKQMFHVDKETFNYILQKTEPLFSVNLSKAVNSSGHSATLKTRLTVSL
jgi:hypothetical protein